MQFPEGGKLKASFGKIIKSIDRKNKFIYDAGTKSGLSGCPIILTKGHKIIGLHKGGSNSNDIENKINLGIYLNNIIKLFPKSSKSENKNIIKCLYDIKKEDLNKEIKVYDNKFTIKPNVLPSIIFLNKYMKLYHKFHINPLKEKDPFLCFFSIILIYKRNEFFPYPLVLALLLRQQFSQTT